MLDPWKKSYDHLRQHIKKQRHYFANKGASSQSYDFSSSHVWIWELDYKESWGQKNWCFWAVMLEKTLESPLDCKGIQFILKEISTECSLEELMLKLKLQYFGHLMRRTDSLEKTQMLTRIERGRWRGWQRVRWLHGITDSMDMSLSKLWEWWWTGRPGILQSLGSQRVGHDWVTDLNWTDIDVTLNISISKSMQSLSKIIIAYVSYCIFVQSLKVFNSWSVQWSDRIHRTCTHV